MNYKIPFSSNTDNPLEKYTINFNFENNTFYFSTRPNSSLEKLDIPLNTEITLLLALLGSTLKKESRNREEFINKLYNKLPIIFNDFGVKQNLLDTSTEEIVTLIEEQRKSLTGKNFDVEKLSFDEMKQNLIKILLYLIKHHPLFLDHINQIKTHSFFNDKTNQKYQDSDLKEIKISGHDFYITLRDLNIKLHKDVASFLINAALDTKPGKDALEYFFSLYSSLKNFCLLFSIPLIYLVTGESLTLGFLKTKSFLQDELQAYFITHSAERIEELFTNWNKISPLKTQHITIILEAIQSLNDDSKKSKLQSFLLELPQSSGIPLYKTMFKADEFDNLNYIRLINPELKIKYIGSLINDIKTFSTVFNNSSQAIIDILLKNLVTFSIYKSNKPAVQTEIINIVLQNVKNELCKKMHQAHKKQKVETIFDKNRVDWEDLARHILKGHFYTVYQPSIDTANNNPTVRETITKLKNLINEENVPNPAAEQQGPKLR